MAFPTQAEGKKLLDGGDESPLLVDLDPDMYKDPLPGDLEVPEGKVGVIIPPPATYDELYYDQDTPPEPKYAITNDDARRALEQYAMATFCWGATPAEELIVQQVEPSIRFYYVLESFAEIREVVWRKQAFFPHDDVDSQQNGPMPDIWDIHVPPKNLFKESVVEVTVPHTDTVRPCKRCQERGCVRCDRCRGKARIECEKCHGKGVQKDGQITCKICHGVGKKRCERCRGQGRIVCFICSAQGQIKWSQRLTVTFKTHKSVNVVAPVQYAKSSFGSGLPQIPDNIVSLGESDKLLQMKNERLIPFTKVDQGLIDASQKCLLEHGKSWPQERIIQQRQTVATIPLFHVKYGLKENIDYYWVYGNDHRVYAPDYPAQWCWGCFAL